MIHVWTVWENVFFFRSKAHATLGFVTSAANFCIYIGELLDFSDEKMERLKH